MVHFNTVFEQSAKIAPKNNNTFCMFQKEKTLLLHSYRRVYRWNIHPNNFFEHFVWKKLLTTERFFMGKSTEISVDHGWFWYEKRLIKVVYELFVEPGNSLGLFALAVKKYFCRMKFSMRYWNFYGYTSILRSETALVYLWGDCLKLTSRSSLIFIISEAF